MFLKKNRTYKPLYKQFIKLKENIQVREKIFYFKKQKWKDFIENYQKKFRWFRKFKAIDQTNHKAFRYTAKKRSYKKRFLNTYYIIKLFKLFYGDLKHKALKKKLYSLTKNIKNYSKFLIFKQLFLEVFERRLDTVLYRSKFSFSMRNSRQLISHGKIFVNGQKIKSKFFTLTPGDLVTVDSKYHYLIIKNLEVYSHLVVEDKKYLNLMEIRNWKVWPIPGKHLTINYKTLQIMIGNYNNVQTTLNVNLNLEKIINY